MYKKLYILFFFLIFFDVSYSQNSFSVINNTGATAQTWKLFRTLYEDHKVKLTYLANELITNNISVGDTIFSIGFEIFDRPEYDFEYQVMYNAEIKITEGGIAKDVWNGNLAPEEGQWKDIFFDIPYVRNTTNDLIVEFCFDNCEWNEKSFQANYGTIGEDFYHFSSRGNSYGSTNNECSNNPLNIGKRPNTRFGTDNVIRKTINVCTNTDSITLVGTSSILPVWCLISLIIFFDVLTSIKVKGPVSCVISLIGIIK